MHTSFQTSVVRPHKTKLFLARTASTGIAAAIASSNAYIETLASPLGASIAGAVSALAAQVFIKTLSRTTSLSAVCRDGSEARFTEAPPPL